MGKVLRQIVAENDVTRVLVTGGDTSSFVARRLGVTALQMKAPFLPAMPICRVFSHDAKTTALEMAFKGGQVGKVDLFEAVKHGSAS